MEAAVNEYVRLTMRSERAEAFLVHEDARYRVATAEAISRWVDVADLVKLSDEYTRRSSYYYDVVVVLDAAISAPEEFRFVR